MSECFLVMRKLFRDEGIVFPLLYTELAEHLDREKTLLIDSLLKPSTVHRLEKIKKRSWLEV